MNPFRRIQYNAPVTITFAFICLAVLGFAQLVSMSTYQQFFTVYRGSTLWNTFRDPLAYIRFFTHVLGHADLNHYIGNFMIILLVGPLLEERYGVKVLVVLIAITALATGLLHIIMTPVPKHGASGVVFMMMLLGSFTNLQRGRVPLTLILAMIIFIGREVVAANAAGGASNIAYMSHIVGGLCGAVAGFFINKEALRHE